MKKGDIDDDINHRNRLGWQKWRNAARVLCDKKILGSLKGRVYRMMVKSASLYGTECCSIKRTEEADGS